MFSLATKTFPNIQVYVLVEFSSEFIETEIPTIGIYYKEAPLFKNTTVIQEQKNQEIGNV